MSDGIILKRMAGSIKYPYIHPNGEFAYVSEDDPFMEEAKNFAADNSLDESHPAGVVLVKNKRIIGRGANGSDYHKLHGCERKRSNMPTGQAYELCEGCHPKNHAEISAITDARANKWDLNGAEAFMWGHWWCCRPCWQAMIEAGIRKVYLLENSENIFKK